jgi:hypothetical protein
MPKPPKYYGIEQFFHQEFNQSKKHFLEKIAKGEEGCALSIG